MDLASTRSPASLSSSSTSSSAVVPSQDLGKDEFLKLLTAQLAHQDPLAPMDNQAFIAQLAQFSSVEQLHEVGQRLDSLLAAQAASNQLGTAALVGKDVAFRTTAGARASGRVSGVEFGDGAARLIVGTQLIPLSDVLAVHQG